MKKLLIASVILLLSGCATFDTLVDSFLMKYDSSEYQQIADIRTTAGLAKNSCDNFDASKQQADVISKKTIGFKNHTQYLPHNDKVIKSAVDLDKMAQGLKDQYAKSDKVSAAFCKIKFETIEKSAETIQKVVGDKPR
jgi:hypothetical protein